MNALRKHLLQSLSSIGPDSRTQRIRTAVLNASECIQEGNFRHIAESDLDLLFKLYDREFFALRLYPLVGDRLTLRLSARLTSAAGKTYRKFTVDRGGKRPTSPRFEIAVSTHLLFGNFRTHGERRWVNGLPCRDRLEALQRIFEHELLHLVEFLLHGRSSCRAKPFKELAHRLFGHRDVTHQLHTAREVCLLERNLKVGDGVTFSHRGSRLCGRINRITKRATVLVPCSNGQRYSDGKRYEKYYVPLSALAPD